MFLELGQRGIIPAKLQQLCLGKSIVELFFSFICINEGFIDNPLEADQSLVL